MKEKKPTHPLKTEKANTEQAEEEKKIHAGHNGAFFFHWPKKEIDEQ